MNGLWDLSTLTRDWTWALAVKMLSPNHWTARKFPIKWFGEVKNKNLGLNSDSATYYVTLKKIM